MGLICPPGLWCVGGILWCEDGSDLSVLGMEESAEALRGKIRWKVRNEGEKCREGGCKWTLGMQD